MGPSDLLSLHLVAPFDELRLRNDVDCVKKQQGGLGSGGSGGNNTKPTHKNNEGNRRGSANETPNGSETSTNASFPGGVRKFESSVSSHPFLSSSYDSIAFAEANPDGSHFGRWVLKLCEITDARHPLPVLAYPVEVVMPSDLLKEVLSLYEGATAVSFTVEGGSNTLVIAPEGWEKEKKKTRRRGRRGRGGGGNEEEGEGEEDENGENGSENENHEDENETQAPAVPPSTVDTFALASGVTKLHAKPDCPKSISVLWRPELVPNPKATIVRVVLGSRFLATLTKGREVVNTVRLFLGDTHPLRVRYDLGDLGHLQFYLAQVVARGEGG